MNDTVEDFARMAFIENEVAKKLMTYRENTEASLVIFALLRCARRLLRLYPLAKQEELLTAIVPFMRGDAVPGSKFLVQ